MQIFGRFVGNGLDRSGRFTRYVVISGRLQRAVNDRPYKPTHKIRIAAKPRAGRAPPLLRNDFCCPVGRGDPTPPLKPPQKNALGGALGGLALDGYSCSRAKGVAGMLSGVYSA